MNANLVMYSVPKISTKRGEQPGAKFNQCRRQETSDKTQNLQKVGNKHWLRSGTIRTKINSFKTKWEMTN